jgi:hypothetical protein
MKTPDQELHERIISALGMMAVIIEALQEDIQVGAKNKRRTKK